MTDRIAELRARIKAEDEAHRAYQKTGDGWTGDGWTVWQTAKAHLQIEAEMNLHVLLDCAEALQGLVAYARDSQGIAGYHLNGEILEWDDVEELHAGIQALARLNGERNVG